MVWIIWRKQISKFLQRSSLLVAIATRPEPSQYSINSFTAFRAPASLETLSFCHSFFFSVAPRPVNNGSFSNAGLAARCSRTAWVVLRLRQKSKRVRRIKNQDQKATFERGKEEKNEKNEKEETPQCKSRRHLTSMPWENRARGWVVTHQE